MRINQQKKLKIVIILFFIFFLVILNFTFLPNNIKNFFFLNSSNIQKNLWQANVNISDFFKQIFKSSDIIKEIENIKLKNQELIIQIVSLKKLEKENEFLKNSFKLGLEKDFQLIIARAISKDIFQDSILINKGKKDGVLENFPVITNEKVLLGRIGQVYEDFSEVILITDKRSSFDAEIINLEKENKDSDKESIYGIARGKGDLKINIELIPKESEIFEENIIISSVLGGIFPDNLLIGKIKSIKRSDLDSFQEAMIEPFFDIKKIDYLFIIKDF